MAEINIPSEIIKESLPYLSPEKISSEPSVEKQDAQETVSLPKTLQNLDVSNIDDTLSADLSELQNLDRQMRIADEKQILVGGEVSKNSSEEDSYLEKLRF